MIRILKCIKNFISPNYWASKIGNKLGFYDWAKRSSIREWALGLKGWKWWAWQLGAGLIFFVIIELIVNMIGMTILPWK